MGCNSSVLPLKYDEEDDIYKDYPDILYHDEKYDFRDPSIYHSMGICGFGNLRDYGGWPSREIAHSGWR